jgi:site-specific DNA-cytosine methylase
VSDGKRLILDLCGGTGSWSRPWKEAGYDVRVITLPENDVRLYAPPDNVYGILAAPPCTEFSKAKHFHGKGKYEHDFLLGLEVVAACMRVILTARPKFWALENPLGYLVNWLKAPQYIFDAWEFGDNYQKRTALWGEFNLPEKTVSIKPKGIVKFSMLKSRDIAPEYFGILDRQARRAVTPKGFAKAFFSANQ